MTHKQATTGPGVVMLSPSLQVLHMNRQAVALLNQLECSTQAIGAEQTLTAPLDQHCQGIIETLRSRLKSNNREQFQRYSTIGDSTHSIALIGIGIPDSRGLAFSRIVVLLSSQIPAPPVGSGRRESLEEISEGSSVHRTDAASRLLSVRTHLG